MCRNFIRKALRHGVVLHALCAIGLAFPQAADVAPGSDSLKESASLQSLAADYARQKQFVRAAKLYEQAQGLLEKSLGANHTATLAAAQRYQTFRRSLMPELLDRFVTITSLAEFRDREFDQTVAEIRDLLPLAPLQEPSYGQIKDILVGVGLKPEAELVLRTGLEVFPGSRLLRIFLAEVLSGTGRSVEALAILEEAGRLPQPAGLDAAADRQQRAIVFLRIGSVHTTMSRLNDAITDYRQAVAVAPDWTEGRIALGRAYFAANRLEEALAEFERAAREGPGNKEAQISLSESYLARGQWELAAAAAERAFRMGAPDSRTLYLLGTSLVRTGRRSEGQVRLEEFAKAEAETQEVERRYREIDGISLAAVRALREGNADGAIQQLNQGIASYPGSSRLHMNLAMVLSRAGQHQKAVDTLESMLRRTNERRFLIHLNLANEYQALGDIPSSQRHRQIYLDTREAEFLGSTAR